MEKITLAGAGGKIGLRISKNLINTHYDVYYLEVNQKGIDELKKMQIKISKQEEVIQKSDIVILAVPDIVLGQISKEIIPQMKSGSMVITLDPAAALAGKLMLREDISYFVTHPCHPSVFNWEPNKKARFDYFGGNLAKQNVVCALMKGNEKDYSRGEEIVKIIFAPVSKTFRITVEQMGLLEPVLVETLSSTCLAIIKEGLDEVIQLGVPPDAAKEFLFGHINIQLAVIFGQLPGVIFSDAANKAIKRGKHILFKEDWKKIFLPENVKEQIEDIIT